VHLTAGSSIYIEGIFDPMRQGQISANLARGNVGSAFTGYSGRSALSADALGGDVTYENDPWASADLSLSGKAAYQVRMSGSGPLSLNEQFSLSPPTVKLASLDGSVIVEDHMGGRTTWSLAPAARGTLELLAAEDVRLAGGSIVLEDVAPSYVRGAQVAYSTTGDVLNLGPHADPTLTNQERGFTPIHLGDPEPVRLYALHGSICAQRAGACTPLPPPQNTADIVSVVAPKPMEVLAGKDVLAGWYQPQHNGPGDVTIIGAGRDVYQPVLVVSGEGTALIEAGRDVVLGEPALLRSQPFDPPVMGGAFYSVGNRGLSGGDFVNRIVNQALPADKAADLVIVAGIANGANYDGFSAAYLDPSSAHLRDYLHADPTQPGPALDAFMAGLGHAPAGSDAELLADFRALPASERQIFLNQVFFAELRDTGVEYNDASSSGYHSYQRGFAAVSTLFPADPARIGNDQRGDVILQGKQVQTEADASITILAPYGRVLVGTDVLQKNENTARGGVVTLRGGDVRIMADQNVDLYSSRVFTQQGGDVTIWTSNGSITAGTGSKTSVTDVPFEYTMNMDAVVSVDAFGLVTGAGIGVLDALGNASERTRSRLDLIAPRGEVNAGDAGIRAVGDLNIAARVVVGLENIQATGVSTGVPKVEVPSLSTLSTSSQVAQTAQKEGIGPDPRAAQKALAELPSIITVEVVGYETDKAEEERRRK
jgi:hypothetical protein